MEHTVGKDIIRKDAWLKVTGKAKYNDDYYSPACLHARLLTSTNAHAHILSIDKTQALTIPGVRAVVTGDDCKIRIGSILQDMPILAAGVTRYFGEPIAIVVADEEWQAAQAVHMLQVKYQLMPVINSISDAMNPAFGLVHSDLGIYKHTVTNVYPEPGTNISNHTKIRKGNIDEGWKKSEVIIEAEYDIPQSNHAYMETRNARAEILPNGKIHISTATQAPHATRALIAACFGLSENDIVIEVPFVGGGYGGKVNPHIEILALVASHAVGGREVRISLTREESFYSSACKIGAKVKIKIGANKKGRIYALQADYFIDSGAYSDTCPVMSRAAAVNCCGVYEIPNIQCDSLCIYTNHVYATSFRGFGHEISTFAIERTIEKLVEVLHVDSAEIRMLNAYKEGSYTATQEYLTLSNMGNISACISRLKEIMEWDKGVRFQVRENIVRSKGMAGFCKTSSSPTDASSSAVIMFCSDGTVNLNCSVVECGPGMTTSLPQILAEQLKLDVNKITVNMEINTHHHPEHWKTVGSMSLYMAGNAIIAAADDAICQIKAIASVAMRCRPEDLELGEEKVYQKDDPAKSVKLKDIAFGVKYPEGNAVGGPIIGRGQFIMPHLSIIDYETGKGRPGPYWTCGAQGIEVEYDISEHSYRLVKAVTVIDAGKVINPVCAAGQVLGGMNTGLSLATREINHYKQNGELTDTSFRTYKIMHYAENPEYLVSFIETPNLGGPYGARGIGEHSVLGMTPALVNALGKAAGVQLDKLPITFENLWKTANGD